MFKATARYNSISSSAEIVTTCLRALAPSGESERIYPKLERPCDVKAEGILGSMHPQDWLIDDLTSGPAEWRFLFLVCDGAGVNKRICKYVSAEYAGKGLSIHGVFFFR